MGDRVDTSTASILAAMVLAAAAECACAVNDSASPLWLLIPLALGAVCFKAAADKGRNRWVWGVVGCVFPLVGLLFVLFLPRIKKDEAEPAAA
jgi:high-affinity K+ transport system ATPase subunit B